MILPRVIPCLLLRKNGLVKGIKFDDYVYVGDPINAVKILNEKEVDELIFLDIDATKEKRPPNFELIKQIAGECFMPFCYGGGINSIDDAQRLFSIGVEKVAINSHATEDLSFILRLSTIIGSQSVVVVIDVKCNLFGHYGVYSNSGAIKTKIDLIDYAKRVEEAGAGEILINSIDRDGMMSGFDLNLIKMVSSVVSIPVISMGGAGKLEDFRAAIKAGASAVAAGSLFVFHGKHRAVLVNYPRPNEVSQVFYDL